MDGASHVTSEGPLLDEGEPEALEVPAPELGGDELAAALVPAELPADDCDVAEVALLDMTEATDDVADVGAELLEVDDTPLDWALLVPPEEDDAEDDACAGSRTQRPTPPSKASHA